jgi:3-hydroxyisobutyrate dehydrogenase-like beta-hydroxyacid dehydrogenase
MKTAMIGCGQMGAPIVGRLLAAGHEVFAHDQVQGMMARLNSGAVTCLTPWEAAAQAEIVFLCLPSDHAVRQVIWGPDGGLLSALGPRTVLVNLSTGSVGLARALELAGEQRGFSYAAAPMSGNSQAASLGLLSIFLGGPQPTCDDTVLPVLRAFARHVTITGLPHTAIATKLVIDGLRFAQVAALSEALVVGVRAGVQAQTLAEAITRVCGDTQVGQDILDLLTIDSAGIVDLGLREQDLTLLDELRERHDVTATQAPVGPLVQRIFADARQRHGFATPLSAIIALARATGTVLRPRPGPDPGQTRFATNIPARLRMITQRVDE